MLKFTKTSNVRNETRTGKTELKLMIVPGCDINGNTEYDILTHTIILELETYINAKNCAAELKWINTERIFGDIFILTVATDCTIQTYMYLGTAGNEFN